MNEQLKQQAQEFCKALTIHTSQDLKMDFDIDSKDLDDVFNLMAKFAQHLIDKGQFVEAGIKLPLMNFLECKNKVARDWGYLSWANLTEFRSIEDRNIAIKEARRIFMLQERKEVYAGKFDYASRNFESDKPTHQLGEVKTLQECKDFISGRDYNSSYNDLNKECKLLKVFDVVDVLQEATELYANQFRSKHQPDSKVVVLSDEDIRTGLLDIFKSMNVSSYFDTKENCFGGGWYAGIRFYRDQIGE